MSPLAHVRLTIAANAAQNPHGNAFLETRPLSGLGDEEIVEANLPKARTFWTHHTVYLVHRSTRFDGPHGSRRNQTGVQEWATHPLDDSFSEKLLAELFIEKHRAELEQLVAYVSGPMLYGNPQVVLHIVKCAGSGTAQKRFGGPEKPYHVVISIDQMPEPEGDDR